MENPIKIHDLGVPLFLETPMWCLRGHFHRFHRVFGKPVLFCSPFVAVRLLSFCEAVRCHRGVSMLGGHGRGPKDQSRWWFQIFFCFHPLFGQDIQIDDHIFSRWVGSTTNQSMFPKRLSHNNCSREIGHRFWSNYSRNVTNRPGHPKGSWSEGKWDPLFQKNAGWWNIMIWHRFNKKKWWFGKGDSFEIW